MKPKHQEEIEAQAFDSYAKKTIKGVARDHYRKKKQRLQREMFFSELSCEELGRLAFYDRYSFESDFIEVLGLQICVDVPELANAIKSLIEGWKEVILLYFFLRMSDREIAEHLDLTVSTVTYRRKASIKKLKKFMGECIDE